MEKIELLAPAGNMECLIAAIQAGCDAVYLGGNLFGARAFSLNFSDEELVAAIEYAHLYGVKIYVTVNTLIYEDEVETFLSYVEFLHKNNVDAVIIQDLGMLDLVRKTFPNLEIHASTQMHIHNLDGVQLMEKLGVKRVVLARETSIDKIKEIKNNSNVELEIFIHGALCISYSGQCLMSSLIGGRSGNRGTCAGSCRLKYDVIDSSSRKINTGAYPLSTKDLNGISGVGQLIDIGVRSLKIEGRMKSKEYVYMVVSLYRQAIDSYYNKGKVSFDEDDLLKLKKIFNRNYTKGFLFNTFNNDIINGYRPNHMGVDIGTVTKYEKGKAFIKLTGNISIGSGLRVIGEDHDVGIIVNDFYVNNKLVKSAKAGQIIEIKVLGKVRANDRVVITLDKEICTEIDGKIKLNSRKVLIDGSFVAKLGEKVSLTLSDGRHFVKVEGAICDGARKTATLKDEVIVKLNKLGDSVYSYKNLSVQMDANIFIPLKEINNLRQEGIRLLNEARLYKIEFKRKKYEIMVSDYKQERLRSCLITENSLYDKVIGKYDIVYSEDAYPGTIIKLPRVIDKYEDYDKEVMVSEIGAFNKLKNVDTDFSLNVTNSYTLAFLHSLGAKRVCLSYELNDIQIKEILDNYVRRYGVRPNVELIVSGYEEVMISKFSLNKYYNNDNIKLRDSFGNLYRVRTKNDLMYIYNYRKRDNYKDEYYKMGINVLRDNI